MPPVRNPSDICTHHPHCQSASTQHMPHRATHMPHRATQMTHRTRLSRMLSRRYFVVVIALLTIGGCMWLVFHPPNAPDLLTTPSSTHTSPQNASHQRTNTSSRKGENFNAKKTTDSAKLNSDRMRKFTSPFIISDTSQQNVRNVSKSAHRPKLVLLHNATRFSKEDMNIFRGCDVSACVLTRDRRRFNAADAVLFNARELHFKPPSARLPGQIWVAFSLESPRLYENYDHLQHWKGAFNWTMTHRIDSDIFHPYGYLVPLKINVTPLCMQRPVLKVPVAACTRGLTKNYTNILARKSKTAAWFVSHCTTSSRREKYVKELQKHIDVDVYGRCGDHRCPLNQTRSCLNLLSKKYRFYLAFENSLCRDYVTEKFFQLFVGVDVIPVVLGGADYKKFFPPGTFINTANFRSPVHLARYLRKLESNTTAYAAMLETKDQYTFERPRQKAFCKLCEMLHSELPDKHYPDLQDWLNRDICWSPADFYTEP